MVASVSICLCANYTCFVCVAVQIRAELAEKELILLQKEQELLERDQTLIVLKEEVSGTLPDVYDLCDVLAWPLIS